MLKFEFEDCPSKAVNIPKHIVKSQLDEQGINSTAIVAKLSDIHTILCEKLIFGYSFEWRTKPLCGQETTGWRFPQVI